MTTKKKNRLKMRLIGKTEKFIEIAEKNECVIKLQFQNVGKSLKFLVHHLSQQYNGKWFHFSQIGSNKSITFTTLNRDNRKRQSLLIKLNSINFTKPVANTFSKKRTIKFDGNYF